jgi:hypothetical protein
MSRIYLVTDRLSGDVIRYVRAATLNGAVRAAANEAWLARSASADELYLALRTKVEVLDALEDSPPEAPPLGDDPGPVPPDAKANGPTARVGK